MPIHVPKAPPEGVHLIRNRLRVWRQDLRSLGSPSGELLVHETFRLYNTTRSALFSNAFLKSAVPTAWLYVLGSAEHAVAELSTARPDGVPGLTYAGLYPHDYGSALLNAAVRARELAAQTTSFYDLRVLRAPSLSLLAIWLHGPEDLLLPIYAPDSLQDRGIVTESELVETLLPLAEQRRSAPRLT